jgi:hypothetical protein
MANPVFSRASLSDVRVIMMIMCALVVELPCKVVMGHMLALKCLFARCVWVPVVTSCLVWH